MRQDLQRAPTDRAHERVASAFDAALRAAALLPVRVVTTPATAASTGQAIALLRCATAGR